MATCSVQWRTVRKGGDPKTDQQGTTRTPGWHPKETEALTATKGGTRIPAWTASVRKRAGPQRPHCAKGRDPRTPASWRHLLLRVVAATADAQWTDGWGRSTYVLALFVCSYHSVRRQCAELPRCPSAAWCPPSYLSEDRRVPADAVLGQVDDICCCSTAGAWSCQRRQLWRLRGCLKSLWRFRRCNSWTSVTRPLCVCSSTRWSMFLLCCAMGFCACRRQWR